jgi:hypothetical protein
MLATAKRRLLATLILVLARCRAGRARLRPNDGAAPGAISQLSHANNSCKKQAEDSMLHTRSLVLCGLLASGFLTPASVPAVPPAAGSPAASSAPARLPGLPGLDELQRLTARFAPTELPVDISALSAGDKAALAKLILASRIIDGVFMDQYWAGNRALYQKLRRDPTPLAQAQADYFFINKGPWSALDEQRAFVAHVPARKPLGANFYPEDLGRDELTRWMQALPEPQRRLARGFFSVIRRDGQGQLRAIPYSVAYQADLGRCAALLRAAAALTSNASLQTFLTQRAQALQSDDYYQSDVAWMALDGPIDVTIGPYEVYGDELLGYKAAFEAYVSLRDERETRKVAAFSRHLQEIEDNLPIDKQYKNPKIGATAPIRVVNELYGAGEGNQGVQSAAYNLPNDERITTERGTKRIMLKNVQEAKFQKILLPMAARVLPPETRGELSFDWFFTHILAHELTHGLGPHQIKVKGRATTPREELKELYSPIEEAKADVVGLYALQYLLDHQKELGLESVLPAGKDAEKQLYLTYLASTVRSLRFGLQEAHAQGTAVQVNYLLDRGAIRGRPDGTLELVPAAMKAALRELAHELLMLEATGDYAAAQRLLGERAVLRPLHVRLLQAIADLPVDIRPSFVTADRLAPQVP